jgi:hypothetical protein
MKATLKTLAQRLTGTEYTCYHNFDVFDDTSKRAETILKAQGIDYQSRLIVSEVSRDPFWVIEAETGLILYVHDEPSSPNNDPRSSGPYREHTPLEKVCELVDHPLHKHFLGKWDISIHLNNDVSASQLFDLLSDLNQTRIQLHSHNATRWVSIDGEGFGINIYVRKG